MGKEKKYLKFREYISNNIKLTNAEWISFESLLERKEYKSGDYFSTDNNEYKIGLIEKGLLRTYFINENGNEYTIEFCKENELIADYRILQSKPHSDYFISAIEDSTIMQLNWKDFLHLCSVNSVWEDFKSNQLLSFYKEKLERERELISLKADERYRTFLNNSQISNRIPQYQIAAYLGITPETLSRIKKRNLDINQ